MWPVIRGLVHAIKIIMKTVLKVNMWYVTIV